MLKSRSTLLSLFVALVFVTGCASFRPAEYYRHDESSSTPVIPARFFMPSDPDFVRAFGDTIIPGVHQATNPQGAVLRKEFQLLNCTGERQGLYLFTKTVFRNKNTDFRGEVWQALVGFVEIPKAANDTERRFVCLEKKPDNSLLFAEPRRSCIREALTSSVFDTSGDPPYKVVCRAYQTAVTINPASAPTIFFSAISCFTLNLLGMPFISNIVTVNVELTVYDRDWKQLKVYEAKGRGVGWSALYWGYATPTLVGEEQALSRAVTLLKKELIENKRDFLALAPK
jgi:hypothetical protein